MRLDRIDVEIVLNMLISRGSLTSTKLAKNIYNVKDRRKLQDLDANIRKKLEKLVRYGILNKSVENGKFVYEIAKDRVFIGFKTEDGFIFIKV